VGGLIEIIHNGSLVCDDIEDDSETRRDKPCLHLIYGVDVSLNAGCLMYFRPLNIINNSNFSAELKLKLLSTYSEELIALHYG